MPPFYDGTSAQDGDEGSDFSILMTITRSKEQYDELVSTLCDLTVVRVIHYLHYTFGAGDEEIEVNGVLSSPFKLLKDLPDLAGVPANSMVPISFWGGPPGKVTWYDGSLLTMLLDKILRAYDYGDENIAARFLSLKSSV
jgi:hypothetical protein